MTTTDKPAPPGEPDLEDWDGILSRAIEGAGEDVRAEQARLRSLGIIDENGKPLVDRAAPPKREGGDFGGWG